MMSPTAVFAPGSTQICVSFQVENAEDGTVLDTEITNAETLRVISKGSSVKLRNWALGCLCIPHIRPTSGWQPGLYGVAVSAYGRDLAEADFRMAAPPGTSKRRHSIRACLAGLVK
jgi:hypothetical protein